MDNLSLTTRRKKKNKEAKDKDGEVTFDPSIAREGDLSSYFRIFMKVGAICHNPALRPIQPENIIRSRTLVLGFRTGVGKPAVFPKRVRRVRVR